MPRRTKGAHLWLRPEERRGMENSTAGLPGSSSMAACISPRDALRTRLQRGERKLAEHVARKYQPSRKERDIDLIDVADVLTIYLDDTGPRQASRAKFDARIGRLNEYWGGKKLAEVTGETCRDDVRRRGAAGGARRDLEDLRAAIEHHAKEGLHRGLVRVTLPPNCYCWLTRAELAAVLLACWRYREVQTVHRGKRKGEPQETEKRPLRHLARFILLAIYSGSRAGAVLTASPCRGEGRSYVDLERGIFYRLAEGARATQTSASRRCRCRAACSPICAGGSQKGIVSEHFVEWNGRPVKSVKTAFKTALRLAKVSGRISL